MEKAIEQLPGSPSNITVTVSIGYGLLPSGTLAVQLTPSQSGLGSVAEAAGANAARASSAVMAPIAAIRAIARRGPMPGLEAAGPDSIIPSPCRSTRWTGRQVRALVFGGRCLRSPVGRIRRSTGETARLPSALQSAGAARGTVATWPLA